MTHAPSAAALHTCRYDRKTVGAIPRKSREPSQRIRPGIVYVGVFLIWILWSTLDPYFSFISVTNEAPIAVQRQHNSFKYHCIFGACLLASLRNDAADVASFPELAFKWCYFWAGPKFCLQHLWLLHLTDCEMTSLDVMWQSENRISPQQPKPNDSCSISFAASSQHAEALVVVFHMHIMHDCWCPKMWLFFSSSILRRSSPAVALNCVSHLWPLMFLRRDL